MTQPLARGFEVTRSLGLVYRCSVQNSDRLHEIPVHELRVNFRLKVPASEEREAVDLVQMRSVLLESALSRRLPAVVTGIGLSVKSSPW